MDEFTTTEVLEQAGAGPAPGIAEEVAMSPTGDHEARLKRIEEYLGFRQPATPAPRKVERKLDTPEYRASKQYR